MKKISHKIMSTLMAIVVFFSTMSFTIDMHYCGENLVDTAIFQKVKRCGMEMQKPLTKGCSIAKKNCCSDKQIAIDGQDNLKLSFDTLTLEQQQFVGSFIYSTIKLFEGVAGNTTSFLEYPPPLIVKSIFKHDQTYLI